MTPNDTTQPLPRNTCGACRYFHEVPLPPGPALLSGAAGRAGECRFAPPQLALVPGPGGAVDMVSLYPRLPAAFAACAQHAPSLEVIAQ